MAYLMPADFTHGASAVRFRDSSGILQTGTCVPVTDVPVWEEHHDGLCDELYGVAQLDKTDSDGFWSYGADQS